MGGGTREKVVKGAAVLMTLSDDAGNLVFHNVTVNTVNVEEAAPHPPLLI